MLRIRTVSFFIIGVVFAVNVNAQLCGDYTTTLRITDRQNREIKNALIQIFPIAEDETNGKVFVPDKKDSSVFTITFQEGYILNNEYKIMVSSDGFLPFEKLLKFPHCTDQEFDVHLDKNK